MIKLHKRSQSITWLIYIVPAFGIYLVFMAFPLLNSIRLSLFTGIHLDEFIGLKNYVRLFSAPELSERYFSAFAQTWYFFAIHMIVQNVLGLLFAHFLDWKLFQRAGSVYRVIIFLPATMAVLVTGYLWKLILNPQWGAFNLILRALSLEGTTAWLGDTSLALTMLSLVSSWQWVGIPTMLFLAGMQTIPNELYEAAETDGAGAWRTFWYIKLPLLKPSIGIVTILTFVNNFNAFDVVFAMTNVNGAPQFSTDILGTFFYRIGIAGQHPVGIPDRGLGAAVATLTFFALIIGILIVQRLTGVGRRQQ